MVVIRRGPESRRLRPAAASSLSWIDRRICRPSPPGRSVRPMLSRNSVSPATSLFSAGIHRLMLPCVWPGVSSTWNSAAPSGSMSPSRAGVSIVDCFRRLHAQPGGLHVQHVAQLRVVFVHVDRRAGGRLQLVRAADVIDVRVRDDDGFHAQPVPRENLEDLGDVVAGIDHDGLARLLVAEDRAVALQHANRQNLVNHQAELYTQSI